MPTGSIVKESFTIARQCISYAILGAAFVIICLVVERTFYQSESEKATEHLIQSQTSANKILLADERLTLSANMAASTGKQHWIDSYQKNVPIIDEGIQQAIKLASSEISKQFDQATRVSNDQLIALEKTSFEALRAGDKEKAREILTSPLYSKHKEILMQGTSEFIDSMVLSMTKNLSNIQARSRALLIAILLFACFGGYLLLRRMNVSLGKTEKAFLEAENEILYLANNDTLTGLANKFSFQECFKTACAKAKENGNKLAVLMLDLDSFKPINDRHGHTFGDLVLKKAAERMRQVLNDEIFCARYGGDEFVIFFEFNGSENTPENLSKKLIESLSRVMVFDDINMQIGTSIGIAVYPEHAKEDRELVRKADLALFNAKQNSRNTFQFYDESMDHDLHDRLLLEQELRDAIANDEIKPFFQPLICLETEGIRGFEILSRWQHHERGMLSPDKFIPLAESTGCIGDLTLSVLRQACKEALAFPENCLIAMNIAPRDMQDEWLEEKILGILTETGFPAHRLEVELTENALINDLNAAKRVIRSLKNLGVTVALDDFGTGYSSLYYLSELPFDKLKIDRSFVSSLHERSESEKIISAIIGLGKSFDIPTVAEGIETEHDEQVLRDMGCTIGQGFLYSKPIPASEVPELIERLTPATVKILSA